MAKVKPLQPFTRFRLIDPSVASASVPYARYRAFGGRNCGGSNPINTVLIDPTAPGVPLPIAILNPGDPPDTCRDDPPPTFIIRSVMFEMQLPGDPLHELVIQHGVVDCLVKVDVTFLGANGSGLYVADVEVEWSGVGPQGGTEIYHLVTF